MQTKLQSAIEAIANALVGVLVSSLLFILVIYPLFPDMTPAGDIGLSFVLAQFILVGGSVLKSYAIRRYAETLANNVK